MPFDPEIYLRGIVSSMLLIGYGLCAFTGFLACKAVYESLGNFRRDHLSVFWNTVVFMWHGKVPKTFSVRFVKSIMFIAPWFSTGAGISHFFAHLTWFLHGDFITQPGIWGFVFGHYLVIATINIYHLVNIILLPALELADENAD